MPRFTAFLRAVNLGKNRRVTNAGLRTCFEELGFEDVSCFRTSGNVIFDAAGGQVGAIRERIEEGLQSELGYEVPVFLRSGPQIKAIAAHEPFAAKLLDASKGKLQVTLLGGKPKAAARKEVLALATEEDRLEIQGSELYWLPGGGTQGSALDQAAIARLLGPATMRTKGTIELIAAKFFEPA